MEYGEFRRHLGKAGMTINEFAAYLGVRPASVSNYAKKGTVPPAYAMVSVLMGEAADHAVDYKSALARFGVIPRGAAENVRYLDSAIKRRVKTKHTAD